MTQTQGATNYLTKSDYLCFRTCSAYCWTQKFRPDLVPPDSEEVRRREEDGDRVESLARELYPDGTLIDAEDAVEATRATEVAIAGGARTLFQASVLTRSGFHARADVLVRHPSGNGWNLVEIKSSTSIDFGHKKDATFQRIAFAEAGYAIQEVQIMRLNKEYRLNGHVDLERLFRYDTSVTAWTDARWTETVQEMKEALAVVRNVDECPPCDCDTTTRTKRCSTFAMFHPELPSGDTVYDLVSINRKRLGEALDRGVLHLRDWPRDMRLNARQQWQVDAIRSGRERVMRGRLVDFLSTMERPFYFLDYETVQTPVPLYTGNWPFQQLPFQYSLHILDEDGVLHHREFLWTTRGSDPVRPLVEALRNDIGDTGSVIVWWKGFEAKRNEEMAQAVPELADFLLGLNTRMVDLMDTVSQGMWVHPAFCGSTSIKRVLPAIAPELSYDLLEIGTGALATLRWKQCVVDEAPPDNVDPARTFTDLRTYCCQDTYAMVRIWEYLSHLAGHEVSIAHQPVSIVS